MVEMQPPRSRSSQPRLLMQIDFIGGDQKIEWVLLVSAYPG